MTFQNVLHCEALDVTLGNLAACDLISNWHVSDSPSLSDHSLVIVINFNIKLRRTSLRPSPSSSRRRVIKQNTTDAASFQEHLANLITSFSKHLCTTVLELNDKTELMNTIIHKAAKLSQSHHFISSSATAKKFKSPWWTKELRIARNRVRRCWNKWKRSGALTDLAAYK